jgi:hypothetical protein
MPAVTATAECLGFRPVAVLLLGDGLRAGGGEGDLLAEEPAAHVDGDRDEQEDQRGRGAPDQVAGSDQDPAED